MSLVGFRAQNHPQQVARRNAKVDVDDREVPAAVFCDLDGRFGFTVDVAAAAHNAKCERYFDRAANGLIQSWKDEVVWCNPPFSEIAPWVAKAWTEHRRARTIVLLLPANRTEQSWWQDLVEFHRDRRDSPLRVEFMRGRLRFLRPGAVGTGRPPFGCCLLIWSGESRPYERPASSRPVAHLEAPPLPGARARAARDGASARSPPPRRTVADPEQLIERSHHYDDRRIRSRGARPHHH